MVTNLKTLDIAQKLFMKFGIKSVTMDDISKEAGISKKTIYNFVENKADLIDRVVQWFIKKEREEVEEIKKISKNALDEMFLVSSHVVHLLRRLKPSLTYDLQKYYKKSWQRVEDDHFSFIRESIKENIIQGKREGYYREHLDEEIISKLYLQLSSILVNEDVFPSRKYPRIELFESFIDYHLHGILNDKGLKKYKEYRSHAI